MSTVFRKRGFDAHKKESDRREKEKESRSGKLWRYFLKDGEEDVPLRFLTEEPILFYEHSITLPGGKYGNETCTGEGCEICADGSKPTYKGAWLVVDGREVTIDEKDSNGKVTGKKKVIKDQVRLYIRGSTDIAKLDRLSRKFGLISRPWFATKTGANTSTSYELDRGEESELSVKEITNLLVRAPEKYREHYNGDEEELYQIVEANVFDDVELGESETESEDEAPVSKKSKSRKIEEEDEEDDEEDVDSGVQRIKPKAKMKKKSVAKEPVKKKKIFKR